jgi:uncharacterized protein with HEPN domain
MPWFNMKKDDEIRLRHMFEAAQEICLYSGSARREDLDTDGKLLHALVHLLEIIGEAANQVSKETQGEFPQLPWADMISMRNRLIHAYFDINKNIVWSTSSAQIPELLGLLKSILEPA